MLRAGWNSGGRQCVISIPCSLYFMSLGAPELVTLLVHLFKATRVRERNETISLCQCKFLFVASNDLTADSDLRPLFTGNIQINANIGCRRRLSAEEEEVILFCI